MNAHKTCKYLRVVFFLSLLAACTTISPYNETAYKQATSIKASSMILMDKAINPYPSHKQEAEALLLEARKAYEYAKHRPKNTESAKQWAIMIDPKRNMLAGFIEKWKADTTLSKFFIKEAKDEISDGFDTISGLEIVKDK
jgi:outer membrane PBP1 activator LpoA protein